MSKRPTIKQSAELTSEAYASCKKYFEVWPQTVKLSRVDHFLMYLWVCGFYVTKLTEAQTMGPSPKRAVGKSKHLAAGYGGET